MYIHGVISMAQERMAMASTPLGIREQAAEIMGSSKHVRISEANVLSSVRKFRHRLSAPVPVSWDTKYHLARVQDSVAKTANYILVLDAVNFCFWPKPWQIELLGQKFNGYYGMALCIKKAISEGVPLYDASYLADLPLADIEAVFAGNGELALMEQRHKNLQEVGRVLNDKYGGEFSNMIKEAGGSATNLTELIADNFSSFNDIASYRGSIIRFLKRAQICVNDLHLCFCGKGPGRFSDLSELTAFADYKIPQILREMGILEYDDKLAGKIHEKSLIFPGCEEEVEIRAATIHAVELMKSAFLDNGLRCTASQIDNLLWDEAQRLVMKEPYHRTITTYY